MGTRNAKKNTDRSPDQAATKKASNESAQVTEAPAAKQFNLLEMRVQSKLSSKADLYCKLDTAHAEASDAVRVANQKLEAYWAIKRQLSILQSPKFAKEPKE